MPEHGTLARNRQRIPVRSRAGVVLPEEANGPPAWMPTEAAADG